MRVYVCLVAAAALAVGAWTGTSPAAPRTEAGPRVPVGFAVTPYAEVNGLASSLAFGPDTRAGTQARRLYVTDYSGGRLLAIDDRNGIGTAPVVFADGFDSPLGVVAARDGSVYVSDSEPARKGPFGFRPYGRVWRLQDVNADGTADKRTVVLKDLPNGRHNTNGMAMGADGMLYITNGNSTDDGVEGGEPEVVPWSGAVIRVDPRAKRVSLARLSPRAALVATGWRNVYDLAFSPLDETKLFVPMNGVDDARPGRSGEPGSGTLENSDDMLSVTDVDDAVIDGFGFPSCLYNVERQGDLAPYDNPNPEVRAEFGRCDKGAVARPVASFGTHVSADGLAFQTTKVWGKEYLNDLFVAEWGSLWGSEVKGHDIVQVELDARGERVVRQKAFLTGGFPLDVTFGRDGAMFVADFSGLIYKVDEI